MCQSPQNFSTNISDPIFFETLSLYSGFQVEENVKLMETSIATNCHSPPLIDPFLLFLQGIVQHGGKNINFFSANGNLNGRPELTV